LRGLQPKHKDDLLILELPAPRFSALNPRLLFLANLNGPQLNYLLQGVVP